ncbi:MAG: ABC transporter ATP-binding protein [Acidimicrobiales bacterium]
MSLDARLVVQQGSFALDVELAAEPGRILAVLGPNGAGKSTILGAIAGTVALDAGRLALAGRVLDDPSQGAFVVPEDRNIGLVPQDLLLFPHLDAVENVAFGARARGADRRSARRLATQWLERLDVAELAGRRPGSLSGGQAQRVALARALAVEPDALLLDEPLSALDAGTRSRTRRDLRRWLADVEAVTVLVTHDPLDALTLADEVAVVEDGRVAQHGPIAEVTTRPRTRYVAELIGTNLLTGDADGTDVRIGPAALVAADAHQGPVFATVSPSAISLHRHDPGGSARNRWPATVADIELVGDRVRVTTAGPVPLVAEVTPAALHELGLAAGDEAWVALKATEVHVYPR